MPKSVFLANVFLNAALRDTPYVSPTTVYVGLFTVAPVASGGGVEVSGGSYSRQIVTWAAPSSGSTLNTADVVFPMATSNWGTVVAFGILDSSVGGNLLYFSNLPAPQVVLTGGQFTFFSGQITCTEV